MTQNQLLPGQELYTPALVRARLEREGGFHARSFTTGALLWVFRLDGDVATVSYSMDTIEFKMRVNNLKSV